MKTRGSPWLLFLLDCQSMSSLSTSSTAARMGSLAPCLSRGYSCFLVELLLMRIVYTAAIPSSLRVWTNRLRLRSNSLSRTIQLSPLPSQ